MAKRTKKTHPERAVLKGSGGEYVVTKVQMLFETTKLLAKKSRFFLLNSNKSLNFAEDRQHSAI